MHKIYAEAVFADNFAVNFIILLFACRLGCTRIRWGRCALGAALGGVYAAVVFGMDGFAVSFWVKLAVSLAMCAAVFWVRGERHMLRSTAAFYMTAFGFAGAIYAVSLCMEQVQTTGGMLAAPSAVRAVLLGLAAGAGLMGVFARIRRRALQREPHTAVLRLRFGRRQVSVRAYIDTGNLLTEPLTGLPVLFLSRGTAEKLLGKQTAATLAGGGAVETDKLRVIPCATAAGQAVFLGIELDEAGLKKGQKGVKAVACIARCAPPAACGAVAGSSFTDELKKGAYHDQSGIAKDHRVGDTAPEAGGKRRVHQRQRDAAAPAFGGRGGGAAVAPRQGGQGGSAGADRAESEAGGVHRAQV